ncbi:hypothetical protein BX616_006652, partial [Lobosporangium transversale]
MKLQTFILALTLAISVQVLAEEVTLGVFHKLSDHESFEKRGEIRFDAEEWFELKQQREQASASATQSAKLTYQQRKELLKQKQEQKQQPNQNQQQKQNQQSSPIIYQNVQIDPDSMARLAEDFVLNVQAPVKVHELEPEPEGPEVDEDGQFVETQEEFEQRLEEWRAQNEAQENGGLSTKTPGSYAFYQIKLKDETTGWEAMSSIKSCLLVASNFQEQITLHLDSDREVFAFDYYTTASRCEDKDKQEFSLTSLDHFKDVKIDFATAVSGPKARYAKAQAIKIDSQTGKPEVEKTFFQKY